ncbi:MAG: glucodextranase DOMON-like domain-containing protein [Chloroflexota bacterium]
MKWLKKMLPVLLTLGLLLGACKPSTPVATPTPVEEQVTVTEEGVEVPAQEEPIYLAIIWHQHQPVYYKDPETGIYVRPWVRVHAAKDYVDMAAILRQYPDIHVTFNLTPSLIRQIDDFVAGAKDMYWVLAEIPADDLTTEQKQFILERFFDTNRKVIARFPRYQELLTKRDNSSDALNEYTTQDFLDLQVLFNLAWTDPDWLAEEPLASLVAKGENFSEEDKQIIFDEHYRLITEVIPTHRELQEAGQIEVTMTPFAHPILPLLVDTNLARVALPDVELPRMRFAYGQDASAQVELGVQLYVEHFGRPPLGMWPAEGSVAQDIVSIVAQNGIVWMASDEGVLATSLGMNSFTRDANDVVVNAEALYRPYYVEGKRGGPVAIVFRDILISDKVGFTYSGMRGSIAALDFINRIHAIREALIASGAEGPFLVSVILDGENAWEYYENDGKEFLHSLYQRLSDDPLIVTTTPSEFLEMAPDQPSIDELWAGSWINHDFSTWIGEQEENTAWDYLARAREFVQKYLTGTRKGQVSDEVLAQAMTLMYIAEGSDWFWWYGADQNSGNDESFDEQFRNTLKQVYLTLGEEPPNYLDVPIIPQQAVSAGRASTGLLTPTIDGVIGEGEWDAAGLYLSTEGLLADVEPAIESLAYSFDARNLYFQVAFKSGFSLPMAASSVDIYISAPGGGPWANFSQGGSLLGFPANRFVQVQFQDAELIGAQLFTTQDDEVWSEEGVVLQEVAFGDGSIEIAIPLTLLGNADVGDRISLRMFFGQIIGEEGMAGLVETDILPGAGPALLSVPDLGTTTIVLDVDDPEKDDYGPGTYTYPKDAVFAGGNFDILNFQVGYDEENIVFKFTLRGPVDNPWGSPISLSLQTLDIYIDTDGDGQGGTAFLPGRNLALQEGYAWDFAITAEGWEPGIFVPDVTGPEKIASMAQFVILADAGQRKVTIKVPKDIIGDNPEDWMYAAMVLSQEGYPSSGVMRVRDVLPVAEQWRVGGAPAGVTNHTRVIDFVWPVEGEQEAWLSNFTPTDANQGTLTVDDFAKVPMIGVGE